MSSQGLPSTESLGTLPRLILSIDIGTSQSAVAVLYSQPGAAPLVTHVARWPGQEGAIYEEKVPSVLLYDDRNQLVACGAEAASRDMELEAEDRGLYRVENFKMHLHTTALLEKNKLLLQALPPGLDILTIYADFLTFLLAETRRHLRDLTGKDPWPELESFAEIVITHPNSWGVIQQRFLQRAAVASHLISEDGLSTRLWFVEEGEASATYCMTTQANVAASFTAGSKFIVCDAGGSTADISAYKVNGKEPSGLSLKELDLPSCLDAGGARVDNLLKSYLFNMLTWAKEEDEEHVPGIVSDGTRDFQRNGKRKFGGPSSACTIQVGPRRMNSKSLPITKGVMAIEGGVAESFFRPSLDLIIDSIRSRCKSNTIQCIILTGGFGESPFLKNELVRLFGQKSHIVIANPPNSKAVAIGGLRLLTEGEGKVWIVRNERPWRTWVKNLAGPFQAILKIWRK